MLGVHTVKVEGGKLLRIKVKYNPENELIEEIHVQGDFFIHPEEFVDEIEQLLANLNENDSEESIANSLSRIVKEKGAELVGITTESIAKTFKLALTDAMVKK
jgi:hypothetical protein